MTTTSALPTGAAERNEYPLADGLLYYFPAALAAVARVSKIGNDQHNPGEPMHWARGKSTDHANKILRHQMDAGTLDGDGTRHSAKVAWRALAQLQEELEREEGAPLPRNAKAPLQPSRVATAAELDAAGCGVLTDEQRRKYGIGEVTPCWHVSGNSADFTVRRDVPCAGGFLNPDD